MNAFLAVGSNTLIVRSVDGITWTQVFRDSVKAMTLVQVADNGSGTLVVGPEDVIGGGLAFTNRILVSHDNGVTWAQVFQTPQATANNGGTLNDYPIGDPSTQSSSTIWDGNQFVIETNNTFSPWQGLFSPDGDNWTMWALHAGPSADGGTISPDDMIWWPPGNVYVGFISDVATQPCLVWSPTAGKNAPDYALVFNNNDWLIGTYTTPTFPVGFLRTKPGAYILAFNGSSAGDSVIFKSTDGKAWIASAGLDGFEPTHGKDSVYYDSVLDIWVFCGFDNNGQGLYTSPGSDGLTLTKRLYDPTFTTYNFYSVRRTGWFLTAVGDHGIFYTSTDGATWTAINDSCPSMAPPDYLLSFVHSFGTNFIVFAQPNNADPDGFYTTPDGINYTLRYNSDSPTFDRIWNVSGPSDADELTSYINPCTGQPVFPPSPPPPTTHNNFILLYYLGRNKGWSRMVEPLVPGGARLTTIKEIQTAAGGTGAWPLAGNGDYAMIALADDMNSYVFFAGTQDGSLTATCVTQPLPPPADLPVELRNSRKIFHSIWVEGEDLGNWQVFFATDVQFNADGTVNNYPYGPMSIINNKVDMEIQAKQVVIKFVHSVASANGITPLLTYVNLDYDILAESN